MEGKPRYINLSMNGWKPDDYGMEYKNRRGLRGGDCPGPISFFPSFLLRKNKMRVLNSFTSLAVVAYLTSGVIAGGGGNTDTCAQISNQELRVPQPLFPQNLIPVGLLSELCFPFRASFLSPLPAQDGRLS